MNIGLLEILADPMKAGELPPTAIVPMLSQLAAIQSVLAASLIKSTESANAAHTKGDKLLDVKEAADKLSVTEDWLYRKGSKLPFVVRIGRNIRFSEQGIERYIRQRLGK